MRYISDKVISFSIRVKGSSNNVRVSFLSVSTGGSSFLTNSAPLVEAMEKSKMYGSLYRRAPECANETLKKKEPSGKAASKKRYEDVKGVSSWPDAVSYLVEGYGIEPDKLMTPESILQAAESKGIKFPDLG